MDYISICLWYTWYIPYIYHVYSCIYSLYTCWYSIHHIFFRISRLPSTKRASLSWHIWQRARSTRWGWFWYPWYTISVGNIGVQWHNRILQTCLVSDRKRHNIHTFQTVEFEPDLYCGVMSASCYPFDMECHRFRGRNVKVYTYTWYMLCIYYVYVCNISCTCLWYPLHMHGLTKSCSLQEFLATIPLHHAFWTVMRPQQFHTSTTADRGTLLSAAVPMGRALTRGGAARQTDN